MVTATHFEIEDSRRLKPPGRFPLGTKVAEFPTYHISFYDISFEHNRKAKRL